MKRIFRYLAVIFGAILASFSVACILLPNDTIDYGTAGLAILLSKISNLSLSICIPIVITPFLIVGFIFMEQKLFIKAVIGSIAYTLGITIFEHLHITISTEHFLSVAFGGLLLGIGLSIILKCGGCIDGSEILASVIVKKLYDKTNKNYSMTLILLIFNGIVYTLTFFIIGQNAALLSMLVYIVATFIIDQFTNKFEAIKEVTIITKDYRPIVKNIKENINRTCTIIDAKGAINGDNKMVLCYMNYFELNKLKDIMKDFKGTFYTVSTIDEMIK